MNLRPPCAGVGVVCVSNGTCNDTEWAATKSTPFSFALKVLSPLKVSCFSLGLLCPIFALNTNRKRGYNDGLASLCGISNPSPMGIV